jgi:hypothetical protein
LGQFIMYEAVKREHKRDVIFDRRLLYNLAVLGKRKLKFTIDDMAQVEMA